MRIPHLYNPRKYQLPLLSALDKGAKRAVWVVHRRGGKDKTCWNYTIKRAVETVGTYFYCLPSYTQAKKVIWDGIDSTDPNNPIKFLDHIPKGLVSKINETDMRIELINGSAIQLIGADNIDKIVGTNPIGIVLSEYSIMKPEVWQYLRPILAQNGGWAIFIFTPRGMNHGWEILQQAKQEGWFWEVLTVEDTKAIPDEAVEAERRTMPQALFNQEYMCDFVEGASAFFRRIEDNLWDGNLQPEPHKLYQGGADLAKYQDWTVLTPIDRHTFKVGKQERFNQVDWNLVQAKVEAFSLRYNKAQTWIDSTGVGDPIFEDLQRKGVNVSSFKFTEQSRTELLNNLSIMLEQDKIKIPNDPILIDELRSFQYTLSDRGKIKIGVPEGQHDDCVMSLALAVWGLTTPLPAPTGHYEDTAYEADSY